MSCIKLKPELHGVLSKEDVKEFITSKYPQLDISYYGWVVIITKSFGTRIQLLIKKDKIKLVPDVSQKAKVLSILTIFIGIIFIAIKYNKERNTFMKEIEQVLSEKYS